MRLIALIRLILRSYQASSENIVSITTFSIGHVIENRKDSLGLRLVKGFLEMVNADY